MALITSDITATDCHGRAIRTLNGQWHNGEKPPPVRTGMKRIELWWEYRDGEDVLIQIIDAEIASGAPDREGA